MADPKLRVKASGLGGSGYKIPTHTVNKKPRVVPGVTTVLGVLEKGGIRQWAVDQTAAYAVANADKLLQKDLDQGFGFLRFFHSRKVDFDNPETNLRNYHDGVLNDLADLGTSVHDWVEAHVNGLMEPDITRPEQAQMIEAFLTWLAENDVEVHESETTVYNPWLGYAGTLDHNWTINGVRFLLDVKTSRAVRDTHYSQVAALGACGFKLVEVDADQEGAVRYEDTAGNVSYWVEEPSLGFEKYGILQIRPDDIDTNGNLVPAFCKLHVVDQRIIDVSFKEFEGALVARLAQQERRSIGRQIVKEEENAFHF